MKKPWLSKSIIFNIVFAVSALYPPVNQWMAKNIELMGTIWGGVNVLLRFLTKDKISLGE